jgi:hypothetical protein
VEEGDILSHPEKYLWSAKILEVQALKYTLKVCYCLDDDITNLIEG